MNIYQIVLIAFAVVVGIIILYGLYKSKKRGVILFKSSLWGLITFALVAFLGQFTGVYIGLNIPSLICASLLGVPGVILMTVINFL